MIDYFIKNSEEILEWCNNLLPETNDVLQPLARIKPIKTPHEIKYKIPPVLNKSFIRGLALFELYPGCYVYPHNHKDSSYAYIENGEMIHVPWDGVVYKTTHFVLQTNEDAYFMMGDVKHIWQMGVMEELDVIHKTHWATNPGKTSIRFLYIDYYEN